MPLRRIVGAASVVVTAAAATAGLGAQPAGASVWNGVYTDAQAARGQDVYLRECTNCHGASLAGADVTPALTGGAFGSNWNGLTAGDLFERIRTTMPADRPGALTRQQNADVIAFVLKANGWPAGTAELARDVAALKQIAIVTIKPER